MSGEVTIRDATSADLPQILALAEATRDAPIWTEAHYAKLLTTSNDDAVERLSFVASCQSALVGFCMMRVTADEAELESLVVAANCRRRGIGRKLLQAASERAQSTSALQIWLEVRESNTAALALYRSLGFAVAGRRRSYYHDPVEDAVLMRAILNVATHLQ